jgi:hypothetical protein
VSSECLETLDHASRQQENRESQNSQEQKSEKSCGPPSTSADNGLQFLEDGERGDRDDDAPSNQRDEWEQNQKTGSGE